MKTTKDMDFLLGILTGVALMLVLGIYLNEREKKRKKEKAHPPGTVGVYIDGIFIGTTIKPTEFPDSRVTTKLSSTGTLTFNSPTLQQQLQDAIDREDYAAAARLRDLIQKTK